jgi:very-short-patch-repair endonuclease
MPPQARCNGRWAAGGIKARLRLISARRALPLPACGERSTREARRVRGPFGVRSAKRLTTNRARRLRRESTKAEWKLWYRLRARSLAGFKFVRQEPIGPYIVDFVCREKKLIIELDGGQHAESKHDLLRDHWLNRRQFRILRFWNNDVFGNMEGVLTTIVNALEQTESPPHPVLAVGEDRPLPARGERNEH